MIPSDREWFKAEGASDDAVSSLKRAAAIELPTLYLALLRFSNGGEGPLPISPYNFCLDSAEDAAQNQRAGTFKEFFTGFFVFGSSGGGELVALDIRGHPPWPVVAIDATNIDLDESVMLIANSMEDFVAMIGQSA